MKPSRPCCCMSGVPYDQCCRPFLDGLDTPSTPEQLMRSRYTAFCIGQIRYLVETHHPSKQAPDDFERISRTIGETTWTGLKIIDAPSVGPNDVRGTVRFAAFYETGGRPGQLHETSRFIKEEDRWFYLDGEIMPPMEIKRNEPCFCGSGRKFKKCHGR